MSGEWWRGCVVYQIYPSSYQDSNGDGYGDLPGIIQHLQYIADLGVDAIWISPFFKSPRKDFGYDVSDYCEVDPIFGTLDDFKILLETAHSLGLKVIIDQVLSHTSDQHAWFLESRENKTNSKQDWYVWSDPKEDGTVPNNWLSVFGGSAWQWEPRRQQYYLHNFLKEQPDLNFHNQDVRASLLEAVKFWLELGVDGFRLDTVNLFFHNPNLIDNPAVAQGERKNYGSPIDNPYSYQQHIHDMNQPQNLEFLKNFRELLNQYGITTSVGEVSGSADSLKTLASYTSGGDKIHMAYTFRLLTDEFSPQHVRNVVEDMESLLIASASPNGWPCWCFSNHDITRVATRWGGVDPSDDFVTMILALLFSLRGSVNLYQGEELGLTDTDVPFDALQDPYGIAFWPKYKGRDGCRTPMPWDNEKPYYGFSSVKPWLPSDASHTSKTVDLQQRDPNSILNRCKRLLRWRKSKKVLVSGNIRFSRYTNDQLLSFYRTGHGATVLCVFNFKNSSYTFDIKGEIIEDYEGHGFDYQRSENRITLPSYGACFLNVKNDEIDSGI